MLLSGESLRNALRGLKPKASAVATISPETAGGSSKHVLIDLNDPVYKAFQVEAKTDCKYVDYSPVVEKRLSKFLNDCPNAIRGDVIERAVWGASYNPEYVILLMRMLRASGVGVGFVRVLMDAHNDAEPLVIQTECGTATALLMPKKLK